MSKIRRVDFSPDEFLSGVSNLKHDEIGPYWVACCLMYSRGGPIDDDDVWIAKACGCHWRTWRAIKERLLAIGKLRRTDDGQLINGRTMNEIEAAGGRIEQAREGGRASGRSRRLRGSGTPQDAVRNASGSSQDEPELFNSNGLGRTITNHQPPTTNVTTSRTEERGARRSARTPSGDRADRRTKLSEDWTLTDKLKQWTEDTIAATGRTGGIDIGRELARFKAHHIGKATMWVRWDQAWHTWIFKAIEWSERNGSSISRQGTHHDKGKRHTNVDRAAAFAAGLSRSGGGGPSDDDDRA